MPQPEQCHSAENPERVRSGILGGIERGFVLGDATTSLLEDLRDEELVAQRQEPASKSRNELAQHRLNPRIQRMPVRVQERVFCYRLHGSPPGRWLRGVGTARRAII